MKANILVSLGTLLAPALTLAHGQHAAAPADSLLHLLAHHWPLLLGGAALIAVYRLARRHS